MINQQDPVDRWFLQRYGKFTASMIHKLLASNGTTMFMPGGWSYIQEKAIESMTTLYERPELEFVEALMHGKAYEEHAYNEYVNVSNNYNMRHFGSENPIYLEYNDYSGGSPDGLMGQDVNIDWLWEGKCPKNPKNHFLYLNMKSQWDLKEKRPEYYAQIQFLIKITGARGADFSSYDERWHKKELRTKIITVLPDKKLQDHLEIKIQTAEKEKQKIISSL